MNTEERASQWPVFVVGVLSGVLLGRRGRPGPGLSINSPTQVDRRSGKPGGRTKPDPEWCRVVEELCGGRPRCDGIRADVGPPGSG
jgi:hypothetical protein